MCKVLIIVDMLNDFIRPDGKLYFEGGRRTIAPIITLKEAFLRLKAPVIYDNDAHPEDSEEFKVWPPHCIQGTAGAQVIDELTPSPGDIIIEKDDLCLFSNPKTDAVLRDMGAKELYIVGVATEYCVYEAAMKARRRGFTVYVVEEGVAGVELNAGDIRKAVEGMHSAGVRFISLDQALEGLAAPCEAC